MRRSPPLIPLLLCAGAGLLGLLALLRWGGAGRGLAGEGRVGETPGARATLESADDGIPLAQSTPAAERARAEGLGSEPGAAQDPAPDPRIDGLVLQPDGQPAARARVQFVQVRYDRAPENQVEDSTVTDERGLFTINPAPLGPLRLVATHEQYAPSAPVELELQPGERKRELRLKLREYGRLRGLVLDAHNVARAKVAVTCEDMSSRKALFGECDGAGRFEFDKVFAGIQRVSFALPKPEIAELRADAPFLANLIERGDQQQFVEVRAGETVEVVLGGIPAGGVRVHGRVHSGPRPLARTWIWIEDAEYGWLRAPRARSDERGEYEVWVAGPGSYQFHLIGAGGMLDLVRTVEITETREQELDLDLPGASLSGRVVDGSGHALTEVHVSIQDAEPAAPGPGAGFDLWMPHGTVDAQGRFAFANLPAGHYELHAVPLSKPDAETPFASSEVHGLTLEAGQSLAEIEIVLRPGCVVRGVVRGMPPVAGLLRAQVFSGGGRVLADTRVDADGSFVLRGLQAGTYELRAIGGGFAAPACSVEARADRETEAVLDAGHEAQLRIRAHWAPGETPPELEVLVRDRCGIVYESTLAPDPEDRLFASLAPGSCVVEIRAPGGWQGSESLAAESGKRTEVDVLVRRTK